ncbi:MAG TPA: 50S ribosomal protein L11 methyltransferase [Candidatus Methylomirabilis sp.]|nr:50S ribosomal protein L11 methyltransferase [Candidatus Methylomirabilis sp.]
MSFWQLTIPASADTSDGLTNFLWEHGALGVVEEELPGEPPRLLAFFPETASATGLLGAVNAYQTSLRSLGFAVASDSAQITPLLDGDWAHAWQQSFPPIEVGERLLVLPPWDTPPERTAPGRLPVIIEPGRAFGTGHHGSTEGCLVLIEEALCSLRAPAEPVLDVGTGTGILAIAAVKLGARSALAIDVDPDAIAAARQNAQRNGSADRISLALGGLETVPSGVRFHLVVANLLTHTHLGLVHEYERLVARGGLLILGGMLEGEHRSVADALRPAGFELVMPRIVDGWASLLVRLPNLA